MNYENPTGVYVPAQAINAALTGGWLKTAGIDVLTFEIVLETAAITDLAGTIFLEYTGLTGGTPTRVTRVLLPAGCLHTNIAGIAINGAGTAVAITAGAVSLGALAISISKPLRGRMRLGWTYSAGTVSTNTIAVTAQGDGP